MELREYELMDAAEGRMWWYRALHVRLCDALAGVRGRVLDAGCGTGGLLVGAAANEASAVNDYFGRHCRGALSVTRAQNYVVTSASEAQTDTLSSRTGTAQNSNRRHY